MLPEEYKEILDSVQAGNSVAEHDEILFKARVDTPIFDDILTDKLDLILGTKGSGKTSLFKLLHYSKKQLEEIKVYIISGVEPSGDAVFSLYKEEFKKLSEEDFVNFWKIYLINLIYNDFVLPNKNSHLSKVSDLVRKFETQCFSAKIPQMQRRKSISEILNSSLYPFRKNKISLRAKIDPNQPGIFDLTGSVEPSANIGTVNETFLQPVFSTELVRTLEEILQSTSSKIWILLDQLDVVFEHQSKLEMLALRGLLKAYESFQLDVGERSKNLRIKIFLRSDIFDFLTSPIQYRKIYKTQPKGLVGLTHIAARATKVPLNWSKEQIQTLILRRLLLSEKLKKHLNISFEDLQQPETRNKAWEYIFGKQVEQGKLKSDSLSWIYKRLSDSNSVVTPRSVIDFLTGTLTEERQMFNLNPIAQAQLFSSKAIKKGIVCASEEKYKKETMAEYPGIVRECEKLRSRSAIVSKTTFNKLFPVDCEEIASEMQKIGLIAPTKDRKSYKIAHIFRPALEIHPQY